MTPAQLGARLAAARHQAGLSQRQVAAALNLSRPCVSWMETGKRSVLALELKEMARLYRTPVQTLLEDAG